MFLSIRNLLSRKRSKQQTKVQTAELLTRTRSSNASSIQTRNPDGRSALTRACYEAFSPSQKEEFDLHAGSPGTSAWVSEPPGQQQEMGVSSSPSNMLPFPKISPSMIPAPLQGRMSGSKVTRIEDFDPSLVPGSLKGIKLNPEKMSSKLKGLPSQKEAFSPPFPIESPAPSHPPPCAPKPSGATHLYQSSERKLQEVQFCPAPIRGKRHMSVNPMCFKAGQRVHLAREESQKVRRSSDQFYHDRAMLKEHVIARKLGDDDVLLGRILLPKAVICKDWKREEYAWQVYDDPRFEPATKKHLNSIHTLWHLFHCLCRCGIDIKRIRPEHVLIHNSLRDCDEKLSSLESNRLEDVIRLVHVWMVDEEERTFQAQQLPNIISNFRAALPHGVQLASFCEPADNLWHCRELSDEIIEICDRGFPTRTMLEDHLVERHRVPKEKIDREFQDDTDEE